jgi:hypothetical protein
MYTHQLHKTSRWLPIRHVKSNVTLGIKLILQHGFVIITPIAHTQHRPLFVSLTAVKSHRLLRSNDVGETRLNHSLKTQLFTVSL